MRIRLAFVLILAFVAGGVAASPVVRSEPNLCAAREAAIFSCRAGRKLGNVCASNGQATYRFGAAGHFEIEIGSAPDWSNVRLDNVTGQQGGYQSHIRFTRGSSHYVAFEGEDGQLADRPGRRYSGIAVLSGARGERTLANLDCANAATRANLTDRLLRLISPSLAAKLREVSGGPFDMWF